ncbi:MAG: adenylosuccinate lyase [Deltaproteobacteria bacterium]|jgi:adenylosuccinate lyase|nr:adenylosuccinate lyase [Deltaproteobacteria bacterium]
MLKRYSREKMASIWTLQNQYASWLKVELAVVKAQAEMGLIPNESAKAILEKASFSPERIAEIEAEVNHDVIAFVTNVEENVGPDARYFHFGLTSSDVLDTSLALRLLEACAIIREDLLLLLSVLEEKSREYINLPIIGRSHGIHAEPTTLGLKFLSFYAEFTRNLKRLDNARQNLATGQLSGPVGNYSSKSLSPSLEARALALLGLTPTPISTQVVPRDIHAEFFTTLAQMATSLERLGVEVRHLARTEVSEAAEAFGAKQKGSSAMPHKKNPIAAENISGLARLIRSYAQAALDNVVLWHERDISHSSVERVIAPDATILMDFLLVRAKSLIKGLVIYPDKIEKNLNITGGLYNSQEILLSLCRKGLTRVQAYGLVQKEALLAAEKGLDFKGLILNSAPIREHLSQEEIEDIFHPERFYKWAQTILDRVLNSNQMKGPL